MATPSTTLQKFPEWITMFQVCIFAVAVVLIGAFVASELGKHKNDLYGAMEPEPTYGPRDPAEFMRYQITQADRNALPSFLPAERRREVLEMAAHALPSNADAETPGSATGGGPSPATPEKPKIASVTSTSFAEGSAGSTPGRHVSDGKSPVSSTKSQTTPKELTKNKSPTRRVGKRRHQ
ncbi:uncharacterized protein LOC144167178 [Haemaphysalis longicornis]